MKFESTSTFVWRNSARLLCLCVLLSNVAWAQRLSFDSPEGWAMKHFASATLLSGLQPAESSEDRRLGSVTIGFEIGWLPALTAEQAKVGFSGHKQEDLNKTPIFARPVVRVGLPWKFTGLAAVAAPIRIWDVTPHLLALGLERPLIERGQWTVSWRGYGQMGSARSAFTCPQRALEFAPGSPQNSAGCVTFSDDEVTLHYLGTEGQVAYRVPRLPKLTLHGTAGANFIQTRFQVNAQRVKGPDHTRLWTSGETFSMTGGATYRSDERRA